MLGAQALRTKQKCEQKEKEKRHRERQKNLEQQRERIQKVASSFYREDETKFLQKMADMRLEDARALIEMAHQQRKNSQLHQPTRHHSLHPISSTSVHSEMQTMSARGSQSSSDMLEIPRRSPSADLLKASNDESAHHTGNRFMKWLGLSQNRRDSKKPRRMSTFT